MRIHLTALLWLLTALPGVHGQAPELARVDRIRMAEAFRLAAALGNRLWPAWDAAPFAVLLVTPEHEFLIRHPSPTSDFTPMGEDALLKSGVAYRKRTFSPDLLATFPAVGGVPTIVIGRAENTAARTSTRWVITLLHEHFHQLQYSQPGYYRDVDALGLARGDQTGRWMLDYAFPYTTPEVSNQFAALGKSLASTLKAERQADFAAQVASYLAARTRFQTLLANDDYKYFAFQAWQEGIARYTEYRIAELAGSEYEPSQEFRNLQDYTPYQDEARALLLSIERELGSVPLDRARRSAFYALGAAEGLVLDRSNREWRSRYFNEKFSLEQSLRSPK